MRTDEREDEIASSLARGDTRAAATAAIRGYGPQLLGYLTALLRDEDAAWEVFSGVSERIWRGMERFRGESSVKTWAYRIAWNAAQTFLDKARRSPERPLLSDEVSLIAASVRPSSTSRSPSKQEALLARLRAELTPEERTLLILRVDRELSWKEVASVMASESEAVDVAALRKRFERLRERLRRRVAEEKG